MCCNNNQSDADRVVRLMRDKNCLGRMTFYKNVLLGDCHDRALTSVVKQPIYVGWNEGMSFADVPYSSMHPRGFHVFLSYDLSADRVHLAQEETIPVVCWSRYLIAADHGQAVFSRLFWDGTVATMTYRKYRGCCGSRQASETVNGEHVPNCGLSMVTGKGPM